LNIKLLIAIATLAAASLVAADIANAKGIGLGRSLGVQRQRLTPPAATPAAPAAASGIASQPVMPAQPGAAMAKPAAPAAAGPSRWLGPIAGLAAGIGLAALLSHFGLSEGFASMLLLGLLVIGVIFVFRMFMARRAASLATLRYVGPGESRDPSTGLAAPTPDWGGSPYRPEPAGLSPVIAAPSYAKPLPAGFDAEGFARQAKLQFGRIQAAWDTGDRAVLADVTTPGMIDEIGRDLAERGPHAPSEFTNLGAEVLEVTTENGQHWASVRYTGNLREGPGAATTPFDEVWNLTKPVDGSSGWLLAGIQQIA
jgi:predicted lipid-binding transport protein (Tim44 family)